MKIVVWGLCAVITALFLSCPPYLPEKVRIKTEPAIYLPLGTPDSIRDNLDFPINNLAKTMPSFSAEGGETASYYFHDEEEYGDTQAFIIKMKLLEVKLGDIVPFPDIPGVLPGSPDGLDPSNLPDDLPGGLDPSNLPGIPDVPDVPETPDLPDVPGIDIPEEITIDFAEAGFPKTDTQSGFNLNEIQNILGSYDGLKFRSIPVYLYVSGPKRIFTNNADANGNVTVSIRAIDGNDPDKSLQDNGQAGVDLLSNAPVTPLEFPVFPDDTETPMTGLSPKPETGFDLADILNLDDPPSSLDFEYTIEIKPITVNVKELDNVKEDFQNTPLSVMLVVLLPLQFDVTKDVPILSEKNDDPDAKAIPFPEEGQDLFGRVSEDDEGSASMKDILDILRSLRIDINIENNIGFAGYAPIYKGKPDTADEEKNRLGEISLSGLSSVSLSRSEIAYPLNIWIEMYLGEGQNFEIKRLPEDTEALPLNLSLSITVETHIDKTF